MKKLISLFLISLFCVTTIAFEVNAQGVWSSAELIYSSTDVESPMGVADRYGNLHIFWWGTDANSLDKSSPTAIFYSKWDGNFWIDPTDIVLSPNNERTYMPDAVVDSHDRIHLIWNGATVYYSFAMVQNAESPREWSTPVSISSGINSATQSSIILGPDETLHVVFSEAGGDVYHVMSEDLGETWTDPSVVTVVPDNFCSMMPHLAITSDGTLHLVWTQAPLPEAYPPSGVYYASSVDGGFTWSEPRQFAGDGYGEANIIRDARDNLHVVWNGRATVAGRYHISSGDGGRTWTNAVAVIDPAFSQAGLTGAPGLAADTVGGVYFIGGAALFNEWANGSWIAPISLIEAANQPMEYVEFPYLVITKGNQLHAILMDGRKNLWHTWKTIDSPVEMVIEEVAGIFPTPTIAINTGISEPALIATAEPVWLNEDEMSAGNANWAILGGLVPIILIYVVIRNTARRNQ